MLVSDCDALKSKGVQVNHRQSLKVDLATLDAKQEALKKELEQLGIQKEHIHNSTLEINEIRAQTPMLIDVDVKTLETLQEALRAQCDELA